MQPRPGPRVVPRAAVVLAAPLLALLGACAGTPRSEPDRSHDWPMVPSTRSATPVTREAAAASGESVASLARLEPAAPDRTAGDAGDTSPAALVGLISEPFGPDHTPSADFANVFDRIRIGYQLPEVENKLIDQQVRYFAARPDFLDRTFERAERYLYYVARELEARHMPLELAMLPVIESAYNPYAYSRARAAGIWQFIPPTAKRYEVRINWWQDGRRDIVDSTRAALDYLQGLHTLFDGDWLLAMAAYNCGEQCVQRAVTRNRRAGKPLDYFHLKLPRETRGYVPRLLAMARIVASPAQYGLEFAPIANQPYFAQVEIGSQLDLRLAAALIGVTEDELHALNPEFNRWATDPDGPHHLFVPAAVAPEFARLVTALSPVARMPVEHHRMQDGETLAQLARERELSAATIRRLNGMKDADFRAGADIVLPTSSIRPLRAGLMIEGETAPPGRHRRRTYVIRRGDTLASVAERHDLEPEDLARWNGLAPQAHLRAGHRLVMEAQARHARHAGKRTHGASAKARVAAADDGAATRRLSYKVRRGDTLYAISRRFQVSVAQLREWNRLPDESVHAGQRIVLFVDGGTDNGG